MDINSFVIEQDIKFLSNKGDFNAKPVLFLTDNKSLTGGNFLCIYRAINTTESLAEGASGVLIAAYATSADTINYDFSIGRKSIYAISADTELTYSSASSIEHLKGTTADSFTYKITTLFNNTEQDNAFMHTVVQENDINYLDITLSDLSNAKPYNYLVNNCRPDVTTVNRAGVSPNGLAGSALVAYYTFNREELGSTIDVIPDRAGNINLNLIGNCLGDATSATITGYSYSPCDGGFRFSGADGCLSSEDNSLLNTKSYSGMTYMLFAKVNANSGQYTLFSCGSGNTEEVSLKTTTKFSVHTATGYHDYDTVNIGKWYHIAIVLDSITGVPTCTLYLNGAKKSTYNIALNGIGEGAKLVLGADLNGTSYNMKGSIGLFRIWNRALTRNEIVQNYLGTIPNMKILKSIKIG